MYTQANFQDDLAAIKEAAGSSDADRLAHAVKRGQSLLRAGGATGNIISGGNRHQLQTAVSLCEGTLAGMHGASIRGAAAAPTPAPAAQSGAAGGGSGAAGAGGVSAPAGAGGTIDTTGGGQGGGTIDGGGGGAPAE